MILAKKKTWESFKGKLPEWTESNSERYEKLNRIKADLNSDNNQILCEKQRDLQYRKTELEEELSLVQLGIDAIAQMLSERFNNSNIQNVRLGTGELFYLKEE